jgi:MFS family permease
VPGSRPSAEDELPEAPGPRNRRGAAARAAAFARRMALDLTPLRTSRQFRLLWLGEMVSHTGRHITVVALPFQVYELTRSPLAVGIIGLVQIVPLIGFSLVGGAIADAMDRRKLLILAQVGLTATSLLLVGGAIAGNPPLWFVYVAAGLIAGLSAIDAPARSAAIPNLVARKDLSSAIALNQVLFQFSDIVGPAVGGLILAGPGLAWAYGIDAASFLAAIVAMLAMRPMPQKREEGASRGFAAIREGFAYLKGRRVLKATFVIDLNAMVFGMPRAVFPPLALDVFRVDPQGLGLLYAAPAAGALLGALLTGWVRHVRHQGRAVMWSVIVWGAAIAAFGLSYRAFWLGLVFLAIAGAADVISAIFRSTILQGTVPDSLRGRLSAIHIMVVTGGPRLGDLEAGVVAQLVTPVVSVVSGGAATVLGVLLLGWAVPEFWRYHAGDPA